MTTDVRIRPRVAFFAANPRSTASLDLEGEIQAIHAELEAAGLSGTLVFDHHRATTASELQRELLRVRPTVVHFSGHGQAGDRAGTRGAAPLGTREGVVRPVAGASNGGIVLHGGDEDRQVVSGDGLRELFAKLVEQAMQPDDQIRIVVLNACHTSELAGAIRPHVDFVVGLDDAVGDAAARVFSVALYRELASGHTVHCAYGQATTAMVLHGFPDDAMLPRLQARDGADATRAALVAGPAQPGQPAWDVFIAYGTEDRARVRRLATELHEAGLRVFFDEWEVGAGDAILRRLEQGMPGSRYGMVVVSETALKQPRVMDQYHYLLSKAVDNGERLFPVRLDQTPLPPFLSLRHPVDLGRGSGEEYRAELDKLVRAIRSRR